MKILAIIGSPRKGNSYKVTKRVEERMKNWGDVEFEYLFLKDAHLEQCRGCFLCLSNGEHLCPLKDNRDEIIVHMLGSDGVILVSPVYVMNVTGLMKNFIDRLAFICHRPRFFHQHAMVLSTTGGVGLRPVLKYLSNVAQIWMFKSVTKLGVMTPPQVMISPSLKSKNDKKILAAATKFHSIIQENKRQTPSLRSMIQFRIQRALFTIEETVEDMPADHKHYMSLRDKKFYIDAKINVFKDMMAWFFEKIVLHQARRSMKENSQEVRS